MTVSDGAVYVTRIREGVYKIQVETENGWHEAFCSLDEITETVDRLKEDL